MKVSVVIPAYNEEKYLRQTLTAVCALTHPDLEIIVVDNGSTDSTQEIVHSFPEVTIVTEHRKGTQFARERGRKEATGDIIASIDADCLPTPDWLSAALPLFQNQKIVAITGPYDYYDGTILFRFSSGFLQNYIYPIFHTLFQFFGRGGVLIAGNALIRASTLEKMGGYDTSFVFYGDDTNTAQRLSKYGKIIFTRHLSMRTSARRFETEGVAKIFILYIYHFFKITLFPHSSNNKSQ